MTQSNNKGLFLSFEGGEGSGKSTQIHLLSKNLLEAGEDVIQSLEPGGTPVGKTIRQILLDPKNENLCDEAELLLYAADRAQHMSEVIQPALEKGTHVLSDRHADSTIVYQGFCRGLGVDWARKLNLFATRNIVPDRVFIIDIPVDEGFKRIGKRAVLDRMERNQREFHEKVRHGFLNLAAEGGRYKLLDGSQSSVEIEKQIFAEVRNLLSQRGAT